MVLEGQKVINLWEMKIILADTLFYDLLRLEGEIDRKIFESPDGLESKRGRIFTAEQKARLIEVLRIFERHCLEWQLGKTEARCAELRDKLESVLGASYTDFDREANEPKTAEIISDCDSIKVWLYNDLEKRKLVFVPVERAKFLEPDISFLASAEINAEMSAANQCLAVSLNTAAVFHSMRVAEFGLHKLIEHFQLRGHTISISCPVQFATWGEILGIIDGVVVQIKVTPRSVAREEDLQFYSPISQEIRAFQYAWRDPVMHARFEEPSEAENILNHVERFMVRLGTRISLV